MKEKIADSLRMAEWLGVALVLLAVLAYTAPQQIPVFIYKANLVAFFAFLGYWIDRRLFPYGRPDKINNPYSEIRFALATVRRAIIVGAVVLAGALAL